MKIPRFNPKFTGFHITLKFMVSIFSLLSFSNNVTAVTIFPFVFYSNRWVKKHFITKNRHKIFIHQQMECGIAGLLIFSFLGLIINFSLIFLPAIFLWCIIYLLSLIINRLRYPSFYISRHRICFNRETSHHANIGNYTILRRPFVWIKYMTL